MLALMGTHDNAAYSGEYMGRRRQPERCHAGGLSHPACPDRWVGNGNGGADQKNHANDPSGWPRPAARRKPRAGLGAPQSDGFGWGRSPSLSLRRANALQGLSRSEIRGKGGLPCGSRGTPRAFTPAGGLQPERQRKILIKGIQPLKQGYFSTEKLQSSPVVTIFHAAARPRRLCQRQSDGKNSDKKAIFTCLPCIIM